MLSEGNEPSVGTFLSWLSDEKLKNIITDISTDKFVNSEYTEEALQGHLEALRRHKEKLEKMKLFKVKQMEKTDPVEAAKYCGIFTKSKSKKIAFSI